MKDPGHMNLPNCIYIGPGKTGSTWLFEFFKLRPDVYVTPAKDLYFFDKYFERGLEWYAKQFAAADGETVIAEICHDYIVSPLAAERIAHRSWREADDVSSGARGTSVFRVPLPSQARHL